MKRATAKFVAAVALVLATSANADGVLNIYNWTDYTAPDVIAKFEKETGIKVTIDTYDSNETLLAKLQAGATGYDIIIPTHNFVPIFIEGGLVQKVDVASLPNFANVEERWRKPAWDPAQEYSVPFHWGTTSIAYREDLYGKKVTSLGEFFEPGAALAGRLSLFKTPEEVVNLAHLYLGQDFCNADPAKMQKVLDLLMAQKPSVLTYSSEGMNDRLLNGDVIMTTHWNGYSLKGRVAGAPDGKIVTYAYPKEGVIGWMDNIMIPTGATNVENAKKFMNFMMDPENMGLQSNFTGYGNAIAGSAAYMTDELKDAPELVLPKDEKVIFSFACKPDEQKLIDKVWTSVLK